MKIKPVDINFSSNGYVHKQIHREGIYAIYERSLENGEFKHYEAVKIQSHNGYAIAGTIYPPSEYYPNSNSWGTDGFTCRDKTSAYKRLDKIIEADKIREQEKKKKK